MSRVRCEKRGKATRVLFNSFFSTLTGPFHTLLKPSAATQVRVWTKSNRIGYFPCPFFSMELWPLICFYSEFARARQ
jgi:hypothetical protein